MCFWNIWGRLFVITRYFSLQNNNNKGIVSNDSLSVRYYVLMPLKFFKNRLLHTAVLEGRTFTYSHLTNKSMMSVGSNRKQEYAIHFHT